MAEPAGPKEDVYIDVPLGGLETGLDAERVPAGKALVATDVHFRDAEAVGRRPFFGDTAASNLTGVPKVIAPIDGNVAIFADDGTTVLFNASTSQAETIETVIGAPVGVNVKDVHHGGRPSMYWSSAAVGDITCVVYYSGDTDYGTANSTRADDAQIKFMLLDTDTGAVVQQPTVWMDVDSSVCDLAVPTVRAINGFFVIGAVLYDLFSSIVAFWATTNGTLYVGAIDTDGEETTAPTAVTGNEVMCWDFHAVPSEAFGFIYWNEYDTTFVNTGLHPTAGGTGFSQLMKVAVSVAGVVTTSTVTVTAAAGAPSADAGFVAVYHNATQSRVIVAFVDFLNAAPNSYTYVASFSENLTPIGVPQFVVSANSKDNSLRMFASMGAANAPGNPTYPWYHHGSGGFVQLDAAETRLALLWQGFANMTPQASGTGASDFLVCFGVTQAHIDGTTGIPEGTPSVNGAYDLLPIDAHVGMISKPWWDGEKALVLCATAPPVDWFLATLTDTKRYFASSVLNGASYTYQQSAFVARISSDVDTFDVLGTDYDVPKFLAPVSCFNVDLQRHPGMGGFQVLPQPSVCGQGFSVTTEIDRDVVAPEYYQLRGAMQGVSGRLVFILDNDSHNPIAMPIDGGVWLSDGFHRMFDGLNTCVVPTPSLLPRAFLEPEPGYTLDRLFAVHSVVTTFTGKLLRNGVVEGERTAGSNTNASAGSPGYAYIFYPPFSGCLTSGRRSTSGEPYMKVFQNDELTYHGPVGPFRPGGENFFRLSYQPSYTAPTPAPGISHYMDTGELGAELPAGALCAAARRDRVFYVDCDDPMTIRSSKIIGPKNWVEFNQNLYARIPDTEGAITAIATMDDKVLIFTDTAIHYMVGEGPNNFGRGGWDAPRKIASSLGCVDRQSVLSFDGGVAFLSMRGLDLIDRNLSLSSFGGPAQQYFDEVLAGTRVLRGCVNVGQFSELRWVTKSPDGFTDLIVFNYDTNRWSFWENIFGSTEGNPTEPVATCVANDIHYILTKRTFLGSSFFSLQRESFTNFSGTVEYTTSWLHLQGQQDYFRAKTLFLAGYWPDMDTGATLVVDIEFDYGKSNASDETHTVTQANLTRNASGYFEAKIGLQNQKCESAKITISMNSTGATPYEETRIINIGLEVAPMEGGNKMPYTTTTVT